MSNRAEQRRKAREEAKRSKVVNIKRGDIDKIKQEAMDEAIDVAFTLMMALPLKVLRDTFGFGKKRLDRFIDGVLFQYDCFNEDYVELHELQEYIKEETGVEFLVPDEAKRYKRENKNI